MAKRSRGAVRPGQRRPARRPAPARTPEAAPRPASGLTDAEARRAAEIEAAILAEERDAAANRRRTQERARERVEAPRATGSLAVAAAHEYDYVARDVRRIATVAAALLAILFALWILVEVTGVVRVS